MTPGKSTIEPETRPRLIRRQRRADALRRQALSPMRILLMVLALPLTTGIIAIGVFLRISDYERHEAVIHLVALAGCDAVGALGFGPFREGAPGYHKRNDPDGDGVACGSFRLQQPRNVAMPGATQSQPRNLQPSNQRTVGTAKFLKP